MALSVWHPPPFTVPETIDGNTLTATVVDLNAWVEYEFRVVASNSVGMGEPSAPSIKARTEDTSKCALHITSFTDPMPFTEKSVNSFGV